jgi:DNA-directed RNA polymerase specialized sigma24 family protein
MEQDKNSEQNKQINLVALEYVVTTDPAQKRKLFDFLIESLTPLIKHLIYCNGLRNQDAEDAFQDFLLEIHLATFDFDRTRGDFRGFIRVICTYWLFSRIKSQNRKKKGKTTYSIDQINDEYFARFGYGYDIAVDPDEQGH